MASARQPRASPRLRSRAGPTPCPPSVAVAVAFESRGRVAPAPRCLAPPLCRRSLSLPAPRAVPRRVAPRWVTPFSTVVTRGDQPGLALLRARRTMYRVAQHRRAPLMAVRGGARAPPAARSTCSLQRAHGVLLNADRGAGGTCARWRGAPLQHSCSRSLQALLVPHARRLEGTHSCPSQGTHCCPSHLAGVPPVPSTGGRGRLRAEEPPEAGDVEAEGRRRGSACALLGYRHRHHT